MMGVVAGLDLIYPAAESTESISCRVTMFLKICSTIQGRVAGTGRRPGRDVDPTSRLGSLDTCERNYWVAHPSRNEARRPN